MFIALPRLYAEEYGLSAEALFSFGEAYLKENRYADAQMELKKCLILNPQHAKAKKLLEWTEKQIALVENEALPELKPQAPVVEESKRLNPTPLEPQIETGRDKLKKSAMKLALEEAEENIKSEELKTSTAVMPKQEESLAVIPKEETLEPPIQKGAWTLKEGQIYAEIYTKYYWHNHKFTNDRKKKRWDFDGKDDELSTELKLEYGLTDRYTLMLSTVARKAHWKDSFRSSTRKGFTEIRPGVKYLLFTEPFIGALQAKVKFPLHYSEEAVPALATHQIDGEIKLLTAQPWPELPGYTKFELGFRGRVEEPSNEIPYFLEFGYNLTPSLILKTTLDGQQGVGGGKAEDWLKGTFGPIFKLGEFLNIELGYGNTFTGRNSSAAKEVYIAASRQW